MELHLIDRSSLTNNSFTISKNNSPNFLKIWHYHPELELVAILKSKGTRFIGDNIEKFEEGEVVLIGKNLPHMWMNSDTYFQPDSTLSAEAIAIHFRNDFLGKELFQSPEMKHINALFERANRGIIFLKVGNDLLGKIENIHSLKGFERTIAFMETLNVLAKHRNYKLLSSQGFANSFKHTSANNLDKVYEYVFNNFTTSIQLDEVAEIASMNSSAFSRFFKRVNQKTFSRYLNEIRIGYACKLLIENEQNITAIAYNSGYNNISNFNRQFQIIMQQSPTEYLLKYSKRV